jgi:hypothetical protein
MDKLMIIDNFTLQCAKALWDAKQSILNNDHVNFLLIMNKLNENNDYKELSYCMYISCEYIEDRIKSIWNDICEKMKIEFFTLSITKNSGSRKRV